MINPAIAKIEEYFVPKYTESLANIHDSRSHKMVVPIQGACTTLLVVFLFITGVDGSVIGTICNQTNKTLIVERLKCCSFEHLSVGDTIGPYSYKNYFSRDRGRIFVWFSNADKTQHYAIGATCPVFSSNSATGFGNGGLQPYKTSGDMFDVVWNLGEGDKADWSHADTFAGDFPNIDYCGEVC
jgi:hypothetical protein